MKKVLIINEGGRGNLGDEAIRLTLEKLVRDVNCEVDWAGFSGSQRKGNVRMVRTESIWKKTIKKIAFSFLPKEFLWLLKNWKIFYPYYKTNKYDLILIGGGQLVQSNGTFDLAMFIWVYLFKKIHKKKVILIGVGATEKYSFLAKFLYSKALEIVDDIYARDKNSVSVFNNLFKVSSKLIPDSAICINKLYAGSVCKEERVLLCPVGYEFYRSKNDKPDSVLSNDEYLSYWQTQAQRYLDDGFEVKLFYTNRQQDLPFVEQLQQSLYDEHQIDVEIMNICTLEELAREISKSEVIVSARMHPLILGYSYGCKLVPYRTSEKVEAFEKEYINTGIALDEVQECIANSIQEAVWGKAGD